MPKCALLIQLHWNYLCILLYWPIVIFLWIKQMFFVMLCSVSVNCFSALNTRCTLGLILQKRQQRGWLLFQRLFSVWISVNDSSYVTPAVQSDSSFPQTCKWYKWSREHCAPQCCLYLSVYTHIYSIYMCVFVTVNLRLYMHAALNEINWKISWQTGWFVKTGETAIVHARSLVWLS